jgi:isoamylase
VTREGINFAVFSAHATCICLCFFDEPGDVTSSWEVELTEHTGSIWHGFVKGAPEGQLYGYRVDGPFEPNNGHRFNRHKLLLDPYARALGRNIRWHESLFGYLNEDDSLFNNQDSSEFAALARAIGGGARSDRPVHRAGLPGEPALSAAGLAESPAGLAERPDIKWKDTVIYETHVKGISMLHPEVDPAIRGTYLGLASPPILKHLKSLGITTVQLQPVQLILSEKRLSDNGLVNYWGYSPVNYFIPEPSYASDPENAIEEFKSMVGTLHREGMEVILDVVYNHTAEGNRFGPTVSFRGFDNASYYRKRSSEPRFLEDFTGTGNTLDANHPMVLRLIADSLRYWVTEMGVDGFRFDLATSLAREDDSVDMQAPLLTLLQQDPVLSTVKLIAEPWDLGPNGYQVGSFPAPWTEWNGQYRDTVRRFWKSDALQTAEFATRLAGSSDLFGKRRPNSSINFVTAHDGFTLQDLVSYDHKHNEANLEENRDGHEPNYSCNWGHEGPTDDPGIRQQRTRIRRGLFSTLFLSLGVPMMLGGDELGRTQGGNNNAYCQDNETTWFDWNLDDEKREWLEFCRQVIAFRKQHPSFHRRHFLNGGPADSSSAQGIWWHPSGRRVQQDEWRQHDFQAIGLILPGNRIDDLDNDGRLIEDDTFLIAYNQSNEPVALVLPTWGERWHACEPFSPGGEFYQAESVHLPAYSVTVLRAERHP